MMLYPMCPCQMEGHISTMMDGTSSTDTHGQLHQLQVHKLLWHGNNVVCPKGLNGQLEALQFIFPELSLWDMAAPQEPFQELKILEVDLGHAEPEGMTTTIQVPTITLILTHPLADTIEPPCDTTMAINLNLQGALGMAAMGFLYSLNSCLPV